jgi:hypothetical protein
LQIYTLFRVILYLVYGTCLRIVIVFYVISGLFLIRKYNTVLAVIDSN